MFRKSGLSPIYLSRTGGTSILRLSTWAALCLWRKWPKRFGSWKWHQVWKRFYDFWVLLYRQLGQKEILLFPDLWSSDCANYWITPKSKRKSAKIPLGFCTRCVQNLKSENCLIYGGCRRRQTKYGSRNQPLGFSKSTRRKPKKLGKLFVENWHQSTSKAKGSILHFFLPFTFATFEYCRCRWPLSRSGWRRQNSGKQNLLFHTFYLGYLSRGLSAAANCGARKNRWYCTDHALASPSQRFFTHLDRLGPRQLLHDRQPRHPHDFIGVSERF